MNFITYFDSNYSAKGFTCYRTLHRYLGKDLNFYLVCLDDKVFENSKKYSRIIPIRLADVEFMFPKLLEIKGTRLLKEYYATLTAILPIYIFNTFGKDVVFYTDADIAYYNDPRKMIEMFGSHSILAVEHGFEPPRAGIRYNVGILAYRNDSKCREFLNWWWKQSIISCDWTGPSSGEQGYLNRLYDEPGKFNQVSLHPVKSGVNLGPWNGGMCSISNINGILKINGTTDLIAYHFHEFRLTANGYCPTGWKLNSGFREYVYEPYYQLVRSVNA